MNLLSDKRILLTCGLVALAAPILYWIWRPGDGANDCAKFDVIEYALARLLRGERSGYIPYKGAIYWYEFSRTREVQLRAVGLEEISRELWTICSGAPPLYAREIRDILFELARFRMGGLMLGCDLRGSYVARIRDIDLRGPFEDLYYNPYVRDPALVVISRETARIFGDIPVANARIPRDAIVFARGETYIVSALIIE